MHRRSSWLRSLTGAAEETSASAAQRLHKLPEALHVPSCDNAWPQLMQVLLSDSTADRQRALKAYSEVGSWTMMLHHTPAAASCMCTCTLCNCWAVKIVDWAAVLQVDLLLVPTALHHHTVAEIEAQEKRADPPTWSHNAKLGRFTNFVNLLDMCAVSVPSGLLHCPRLSPDIAEGVRLSRTAVAQSTQQAYTPVCQRSTQSPALIYCLCARLRLLKVVMCCRGGQSKASGLRRGSPACTALWCHPAGACMV